jgi:hypothetical protein
MKYKRVEINYYRIWNHDLISNSYEKNKKAQDWMDKHIRVFSDKSYRQSYKEKELLAV